MPLPWMVISMNPTMFFDTTPDGQTKLLGVLLRPPQPSWPMSCKSRWASVVKSSLGMSLCEQPHINTSINEIALNRNYPFMMLAWKVAPALACGNVVILKPAEQTPLSALYFGKLVVEAGLPAGVVNIIPGIGSLAGKALAENPGVDKIAFTGSTNTGRAIMKSAASNLKNITLECGGKSPSLVFADADIEQAVKWCHFGIMENQGQVCTSTSRIYVQEAIYDAFVNRFVQVTDDNAKIGHAFTEDVFQGPQISSVQFEKILSYIEQGKKEGAKLVYGGKKYGNNGYFVEPTVFVDVSRTALPILGSHKHRMLTTILPI